MKTVIMILLTIVISTGTLYGQTSDQAPPIPSEEEPEVMTRGPVNEAFAQPVNNEEDEGFKVLEAPPPDIDENPPAERPVGDQFAWVPGYWAWDSDRNGYIWVSGCWRAVPPGKYWVPGYWAEVQDGWRWVAGFWAPVSNKDIEYLPPPPSVPYDAPPEIVDSDRIWVPPCWYWSHGRYTLRSGYWIDARKDWVWVPSHYMWTPRGHIFVSGHWDYPLRRRGVLFAPVYFPRHIHRGVRFSYSLSIVVDLGNLEFGFFTRPRYHHYYFGDYYDSFYISVGIFPWFECVTHHTWYDPIYLHDHWRHRRKDPHWYRHERREYERRRDDRRLRPPRTYREMEHRVHNMREAQRRKFEVATPMKRYAEKKTNTAIYKFRKDKPKDRKKILRHSNDVRKYARDRSKWESSAAAGKPGRSVNNHSPKVEHRELKNNRIESKRPAVKRSEPGGYSNSQHIRSGEDSNRRQERSTTSYGHKTSRSPQYKEEKLKSDNVRVKTSPVAEKKKSRSVKIRTPSEPDKEKEKRNHRR